MQRYNFVELDGALLLKKIYAGLNSTIDFSTRTSKWVNTVINSVELHNDNSMFYQVKEAVKELAENEEPAFQKLLLDWNENSLVEALVYLDFSNVFPLEKGAGEFFGWGKVTDKNPFSEREKAIRKAQLELFSSMVEDLFNKGFSVQYSTESNVVHYVPFEKSASMARVSRMLFIDDRLYGNMEERLRLGMKFEEIDVVASKLYAYIGLHLSDAKRIEADDFVLNEETVMVLPESRMVVEYNSPEEELESPRVITAKRAEKSEGHLQEWEIQENIHGKIEIDLYDGEGLISPVYCNIINRVLREQYGMGGSANSLQIRMPFTKGVLHNVDFHRFICEKLKVDSIDKIKIIDAFGQERELRKIQVILTQSMFKVYKDLKNPLVTGCSSETDLMAYYFSNFYKYHHAFYVGITDMNFSRSGETKLNYQFLNTLALSREEFDGLIDDQIKYAVKLSDFKDYEQVSDDWEEVENADRSNDKDEKRNLLGLAEKYPGFLKDPRIKGMLKPMRYARLKDLGLGRLQVSGCTKFLSRDLVGLLSFVIENIKCDETITEEVKEKVKKQLKSEELRSTRFFTTECLPSDDSNGGFSNIKLDPRFFYGILRNPHLSRNEQSSLRPYMEKDSVYTNYFSHLKGILMVANSSLVPQTLGGADFDGDLVKLITDARVNRAINEACYEAGSAHRRKLPLVIIPAITEYRKVRLCAGKTDFQTLLDTFSSQVGLISNSAIKWGKGEYSSVPEEAEACKLKCETCTILTGLEIDAAKTGQHPDLGDVLVLSADDYIKSKDDIKKLPEEYRIEIREYAESLRSPHRLCANLNSGPYTMTQVMSAAYPDEYNLTGIDRLPFVFLREEQKYKETPVEIPADLPSIRYTFEEDSKWKRQLDPSIKQAVKELIIAYAEIMKISRRVYSLQQYIKTTNYNGHINTLLMLQKKGIMEAEEISRLQNDIYQELVERLDTDKEAKRILKDLFDHCTWPWASSAEAKNHLLQTTGMSVAEEMRSVLYNFHSQGYNILYYYLKEIEAALCSSDSESLSEKTEKESKFNESDSRYYPLLKSIYRAGISNKQSKKIWQKRLVDQCRTILSREAGDMDTAFKYVHALRGGKDKVDSYGTFFWDIFSAKEILKQLEA